MPTADSFEGMKLGTLLFGFLGAAVSLSYAAPLTRTRAFIAVASGTMVAVAGAPLVMHYTSLPDPLERAIAFFAGLVAMRLVPALLGLADRVRGMKIPTLPPLDEPKE